MQKANPDEILDKINEPNSINEDDKLALQEQKEYYRSEETREIVHKIFKIAVWIGFGLISSLFVIRIYHMAIPDRWQWLDNNQLNGIDKFLYSGALGALLGKYTNKILK